jgi:hypothetical protein
MGHWVSPTSHIPPHFLLLLLRFYCSFDSFDSDALVSANHLVFRSVGQKRCQKSLSYEEHPTQQASNDPATFLLE